MTTTPPVPPGPSFRNPVIAGFHPDPSVCRVGGDYYLVCSSFEYFPGVPLFHSRDLMTWRQIGNVLDRPGQLPFGDDLPASAGVYAPTIRYHDGRFWVITTITGGAGNVLVTADDAGGPWSDPVRIDLPGIDPSLAWDEDGTCWCTVSGSGLHLARIDPGTGRVLDGPWPLWSGTGMQYPEAPHLYRIGAWWYLLIAEGGTERGHSVSIARARSPRGPFEPAPGNPVLSHRSTDRPVQSTGHADLVQATDGRWWMVLLGTRPRGRTPSFHVLGRETFLVPVRWNEEGWPVVPPVTLTVPGRPTGTSTEPPSGTSGEPPTGTPAEPSAEPSAEPPGERDDFDTGLLAPCWISPRSRPGTAWSLTERPGWLTLHATGSSLDAPGHTFVGRRPQHLDHRVKVRIDPAGARAGLSVRMDEAHHYDLELAHGAAAVIVRIGPARQTLIEVPVPPGPITLTLDVRTHDVLPPTVLSAERARTGGPTGVVSGGPDTLTFGIETGTGEASVLTELDGRYLSTEVATGFTGRVIGVYVLEGTAHVDWFDYRPTTRTP